MKIDLVLSYIDFEQKEIQELYTNTIRNVFNKDNNSKYLNFYLVLKLILKNMSWLNKIYIICKDIQIFPNDVQQLINSANKRIIRVNESKILPDNYITFSSGCIEMFMWKIPELSKYFIYGCDDIIPLKRLSVDMFFNKDKMPLNKVDNINLAFACLYDFHCANNTNLVFNRNKNNDDYNFRYYSEHSFRVLTKSICKKCFETYEKYIMNSLSEKRQWNNFNADIFILYAMKNNKTILLKSLPYKFELINISNNTLDIYSNINIEEFNKYFPDVLCINDASFQLDSNKIPIIDTILNYFLNK